jgi:hypothetical protein
MHSWIGVLQSKVRAGQDERAMIASRWRRGRTDHRIGAPRLSNARAEIAGTLAPSAEFAHTG